MNELKLIFISFFSILIIDLIWIGVIAKKFYIEKMSAIGRIYDGEFKPIIWPAFIVYVLLSIGIVYFVLPKINENLIQTFITGALLGLCIYGVYDMTNYSTLKDWPLSLAIGDMLWGSFLCGVVSLIIQFSASKLN